MEKSTRSRIAMVFCYFGKFPWYFKYFCKSCSCNPTVDFIIITDNEHTPDLPVNLRLVNSSIDEIRKTASERLGFRVALYQPYKLCDLKPAYGLLFAELLAGYDFWGHGDIDVIYGNIRSVITEDILQEYDVISVRPEYVSGFFALYRNNDKFNNIFRLSKDYEKVYQSPENFCFDECNYNFSQLWKGKSIFDLDAEIECMTHVVKRGDQSGDLKAYFKMHVVEGVLGRLTWNNGTLTYGDEGEQLLYHFIQFKKHSLLFVPKWKQLPEKLFISPFYISRHHPRSIPGLGEAAVLYTLRWFHRQGHKVIQYLKWLGKYRTASRRIRNHPEVNVLDMLGTYKIEDLEIKIRMQNGGMVADLNNTAPVPLLHTEGNKFIAGRFRIKDVVNVDVEFRYDPGRCRYALYVNPFEGTSMVLLQNHIIPN